MHRNSNAAYRSLVFLNCRLVRRLFLVIAVTVATDSSCLGQQSSNDVRLSCPAGLSIKAGALLKLDCTAENHAKSPVYMLYQDPVIEGPRAPKIPYIYLCTGCGKYGRRENTIQYNRAEVGTLDLPILFHPTIHVPLKDLKNLVRFEAGAKRNVTVTWQLDRSQFPLAGEWLVQLKMIYLSTESVDNLLRLGSLPPICRSVLARAVGRAEAAPPKISPSKPRALVPFRVADIFAVSDDASIPKSPPSPVAKRRERIYDGCHDVISEEFKDVFSNVSNLRVQS